MRPVAEYANGSKAWYVDGKRLNTEEIEDWIKENKIDLSTTEGQMAFKLGWA